MTLPFQGAEQPWLERVNLWPAGMWVCEKIGLPQNGTLNMI